LIPHGEVPKEIPDGITLNLERVRYAISGVLLMGLAGFVIGMMTPGPERPLILFVVGVLLALSILAIGEALK